MFRLAKDNDCHWYVIPVDKSSDWEAWLDIPEDDERGWDVPGYAKAVDGYSNVTFKEFVIP